MGFSILCGKGRSNYESFDRRKNRKGNSSKRENMLIMKKLLSIILILLSVTTYSQGVKISAMPIKENPLDDVWFPVVHNDGSTWTNYRVLPSQIGKERIDSIVNNWPAGG